MDKLIGSVLDDRYTICEVIGRGGMSIVYRAEDSLEHKDVAIKILKDEYVKDPQFRRRFLNESRAIAVLSHKNIVDVVDVNFDGDIQYIVMEYIKGITLKEFMTARGVVPESEALGICTQLLSALGHAHDRGVIHRDIKPHNIMVLKNGQIKVMDFGIAHVSSLETVTLSEMAIGSVHYISPEQAKGLPTDAKSDIYSVGVILYEMITGKLPFESDTAVSVALMQVRSKPKKPSEVFPSIHRGLEQIILKAMQKNVSMRYQTAYEMLDDIQKYTEDNSIVFDYPEEESSFDDSTIAIRKIEDDGSEPKKKISKVKKRLMTNKWLSIGIGTVCGIVLIVIMALLMNFKKASFAKEYVVIPDFVGKLYADVKSEYETNPSFNITSSTQQSDTVEAGYVISQTPNEGKKFENNKVIDIALVVSGGSENTSVPDIKGLRLNIAVIQLTQNNLSYTVTYKEDSSVNEGTVLDVDPAPGSIIAVNSSVKLTVSTKSIDTSIEIPDLTGKTNEAAKSALDALGLSYTINESYSSKYDAGQVISQSPAGGTKVEANSSVMLIVSKGPVPADKPPVVSEPDTDVSDPEQSEPDKKPSTGTTNDDKPTDAPTDDSSSSKPDTSKPDTSSPESNTGKPSTTSSDKTNNKKNTANKNG